MRILAAGGPLPSHGGGVLGAGAEGTSTFFRPLAGLRCEGGRSPSAPDIMGGEFDRCLLLEGRSYASSSCFSSAFLLNTLWAARASISLFSSSGLSFLPEACCFSSRQTRAAGGGAAGAAAGAGRRGPGAPGAY